MQGKLEKGQIVKACHVINLSCLNSSILFHAGDTMPLPFPYASPCLSNGLKTSDLSTLCRQAGLGLETRFFSLL